MTMLRVASIPIDHVIAEMTAFPLASEAAFRLGITALPRKLRRPRDALWRAAEQELVHACPSFSLDELIEMRDLVWYQDAAGGASGESLGAYLKRMATRHLEPQGAHVSSWLPTGYIQSDTASDAAQARARQVWRWLSFALPPDLIAAGLSARCQAVERPMKISPVLERMLADRGFAEIHLHVGAGLPFSVLWAATLRSLAQTEGKAIAFKSPGAAFGEGRDLDAWLIRAAVARYLLTAFLAARRVGSNSGGFSDFLSGEARRRLRADLPLTWLSTLDMAIQELAAGSFDRLRPPYQAVRAVYAAMTRATACRFPKDKRGILASDPVAVCFRTAGLPVENGESTLVAEAIRYLDNSPTTGRSPSCFGSRSGYGPCSIATSSNDP